MFRTGTTLQAVFCCPSRTANVDILWQTSDHYRLNAFAEFIASGATVTKVCKMSYLHSDTFWQSWSRPFILVVSVLPPKELNDVALLKPKTGTTQQLRHRFHSLLKSFWLYFVFLAIRERPHWFSALFIASGHGVLKVFKMSAVAQLFLTDILRLTCLHNTYAFI